MERCMGKVIGKINLGNLSQEEREYLANFAKKLDYSKEPEEPEEPKDLLKIIDEMKEDKKVVVFII